MKKILAIVIILGFVLRCNSGELRGFSMDKGKFLGTGIGMAGSLTGRIPTLTRIFFSLLNSKRTRPSRTDKKVHVTTLEKLDEITKHPILFMHAETP